MSSESGYKVPYTSILEIRDHPNADRLEIATIYGFDVVVAKNQYIKGSKVLYVPIDSIIPIKLEDELFPEGSKIKLNKHRIRQIRIRKQPSQGMLIDPETIKKVFGFLPDKLDANYGEETGIVKYEPPIKNSPQGQYIPKLKAKKNSHFKEYKGVGNIKWFPTKFKEGEIVFVQEKIHGTNARAGILPFEANTFWKKIKGLFGLNPKFEKCYGSNKVQLQDRPGFTGYYGEDIYGKVFKEMDVFSKLKPNEIVFFEIYGYGIQKNYHYGCKEGEHKGVLFDVKVDGEWLNPEAVRTFAKDRGFDLVPILYRGVFDYDIIKALTLGNSVLAPSQKVREGVVIKSVENYDEGMGGKRVLKMISEKYLDKEQTDFH